jgi:hypothetical protein
MSLPDVELHIITASVLIMALRQLAEPWKGVTNWLHRQRVRWRSE